MESLLILMLCAFVVVIGALVALAVILLKPKKNQTQISTGNIRPPHKDWKSWIPFFAASLVIAIWTIWGTLFFLATVWIIRMDPKPYQREIPYPSDLDKDSAKGIYTWLFLSPFLTVTAMLVGMFTLDIYSSTNQRVLTALIPAIFHLPLLFLLNSKRPFVYRHAQQAIFLVSLRAGMASLALSIASYPWDGTWLFLLGNGVLWFFGTLWGKNQAARRECWWMKREGETILPPEAQTVEKPVITAESQQPLTPVSKKNISAIEQSLHTFRTGTPEERKQAVLALSQLGEVETF